MLYLQSSRNIAVHMVVQPRAPWEGVPTWCPREQVGMIQQSRNMVLAMRNISCFSALFWIKWRIETQFHLTMKVVFLGFMYTFHLDAEENWPWSIICRQVMRSAAINMPVSLRTVLSKGECMLFYMACCSLFPITGWCTLTLASMVQNTPYFKLHADVDPSSGTA